MTFRKPFLIALIILFNLIACKQVDKHAVDVDEEKRESPEIDHTNPNSILTALEAAHGGWNHLRSKNDVEYHYEYTVPEGKADISTERYIFDDEISFGNYDRHEINTIPNEKGTVTHLFDGTTTTVTLNDENIKKQNVLTGSQFLRRANYFWFVMPYKLNDSGTISKYLGTEVYNGITYTKLEVTYDPKITGKEQNDVYILYVNPDTYLIDRFYFSLPFLGINAPVILAEYTYEMVEGQKLATNRIYFLPDTKGAYGEIPSIIQTLSQIKFDNGFTKENIFSVN